jgi:hypothetical protein
MGLRVQTRADDLMTTSINIMTAAGCAGYPAPRFAVLLAREGVMV